MDTSAEETPSTVVEGDVSVPVVVVEETPVTWEDIYARVEDPRHRTWLEEQRARADRNGLLDDLLKDDAEATTSLKELLAKAEQERDEAKATASTLLEAQERQAALAWVEEVLAKNPDWRQSFEVDEDDTGGAVGIYAGLLKLNLSEEEATLLTRKRLGLAKEVTPVASAAPTLAPNPAPAPTPTPASAPPPAPTLTPSRVKPSNTVTETRAVRGSVEEQLGRVAPKKAIGDVFKQ